MQEPRANSFVELQWLSSSQSASLSESNVIPLTADLSSETLYLGKPQTENI
jgi:hypothetical protein